MYKELDIIKLLHKLEDYGLEEGTIGTIVSVFENGAAYDVEFLDESGETTALVTLGPEDIMPATASITHTWGWEKLDTEYQIRSKSEAQTEEYFYNYQ